MANQILSKANPFLAVKEVADLYTRKNFQNLSDYFTTQNQLLDFKFFEVIFTGPESKRRIAHGLNRAPRDFVRTEFSGEGVVTLERPDFDDEFIYLSATAACRLRFFVGTYWDSPALSNPPDDTVEVWSNLSSSSSTSSDATNPFDLKNLGVTATAKGTTLALSFTDASGGDLSTDNPAVVGFRSTTATDGGYASVSITSTTALTVSSGSTLGTTAAKNEWLYVYACYLNGKVYLGISGSVFDEGILQTTTAEGNAGAADSQTILYTSVALTNCAVRLVRRLKSNQATAGTWATALTQSAPSLPFARRIPKYTKLTAASGTFTPDPNSKYAIVRMAGGGGGGGGDGTTTTGGTGGTGGSTTFGTSLLTCTGGTGGTPAGVGGVGLGGTATIGAGATGTALTGGGGFPAPNANSGVTFIPGGSGGDTPYYNGGGRRTIHGGGASDPGLAGTGGGGQGAGAAGAAGLSAAAGGGSGAFIEAVVPLTQTSYPCGVGLGGLAGTVGSSGTAGAAGGTGVIEVWEY